MGNKRAVFLGLILGFLFVLCFIAFELSFCSTANGQEVEIDALIIDRTQTRTGHEFHRNFVIFWKPSQKIKGYNILINEKANPRWGSLIWIEVGGLINKKTVYKKLLKPRTREIEEASKEGAIVVKNYFCHLQKYEKEIKGEDMKGNGIY